MCIVLLYKLVSSPLGRLYICVVLVHTLTPSQYASFVDALFIAYLNIQSECVVCVANYLASVLIFCHYASFICVVLVHNLASSQYASFVDALF